MPLFASIDVGSNTLRLLIGKVEGHRVIDVFSDRKITRLGNRVGETGKLQDENIEASVSVLKEFAAAMARYGVRRIKAVATSAVREASNSDVLIGKIFNQTGISVEVISGEREAGLTLNGVLSSLPKAASVSLRPTLVIDIGGGSTEWILYRDSGHIETGSVPLGVITLTQRFLKNDPIPKEDMAGLNSEITSVVEYLGKRTGRLVGEDSLFIGTAGTFTTIASVDLELDSYSRAKIHLHKLPVERLKNMFNRLRNLTLVERKRVKGLEPERADLIIPGILFTISVMDFFGFPELVISDYGLLEGAMLEMGDEGE